MTITILQLIYFSFVSALFFKIGIKTHVPSLILFIVSCITIITVIGIFYFDPCPFDYFRFSFKRTFFAINH